MYIYIFLFFTLLSVDTVKYRLSYKYQAALLSIVGTSFPGQRLAAKNFQYIFSFTYRKKGLLNEHLGLLQFELPLSFSGRFATCASIQRESSELQPTSIVCPFACLY